MSAHEEIRRLLRLVLSNFVKARVIHESTDDLTSVPYATRAAQLDDEDLGLGTAARKFLSEGIVNAEDDADDAYEGEARWVISPEMSAKLYK